MLKWFTFSTHSWSIDYDRNMRFEIKCAPFDASIIILSIALDLWWKHKLLTYDGNVNSWSIMEGSRFVTQESKSNLWCQKKQYIWNQVFSFWWFHQDFLTHSWYAMETIYLQSSVCTFWWFVLNSLDVHPTTHFVHQNMHIHPNVRHPPNQKDYSSSLLM